MIGLSGNSERRTCACIIDFLILGFFNYTDMHSIISQYHIGVSTRVLTPKYYIVHGPTDIIPRTTLSVRPKKSVPNAVLADHKMLGAMIS